MGQSISQSLANIMVVNICLYNHIYVLTLPFEELYIYMYAFGLVFSAYNTHVALFDVVTKHIVLLCMTNARDVLGHDAMF